MNPQLSVVATETVHKNSDQFKQLWNRCRLATLRINPSTSAKPSSNQTGFPWLVMHLAPMLKSAMLLCACQKCQTTRALNFLMRQDATDAQMILPQESAHINPMILK